MTRFFSVTKFIILALPFFYLWPGHSRAEFNATVTGHERAVFSFFKLARTAPDYPTWIRSSDLYKKAKTEEEKEKIYERESLRLKWGFGTHDIEENPLKITTAVLLQLRNDRQGKTLNFKFPNSDDKYIPFFPYAYGDEWISLIVNDLEKFVTVTLTDKEFKAASDDLKVGPVYSGQLKMRIRPTHADHEKPLYADGIEQWLMVGETAYIEFSYKAPQSGIRKKLWEYVAPWYLNPSETLLLDLLEE